MDHVRPIGAALVVGATDAAMLYMGEEILDTPEAKQVMGEEILDMLEVKQLMDGATLAIRLIDQASNAKTDLLHFDHRTIAPARLIPARSVSTRHHNTWLVGTRSSRVANWLLPA